MRAAQVTCGLGAVATILSTGRMIRYHDTMHRELVIDEPLTEDAADLDPSTTVLCVQNFKRIQKRTSWSTGRFSASFKSDKTSNVRENPNNIKYSFLRCFRDSIRVPRVENRVPNIFLKKKLLCTQNISGHLTSTCIAAIHKRMLTLRR